MNAKIELLKTTYDEAKRIVEVAAKSLEATIVESAVLRVGDVIEIIDNGEIDGPQLKVDSIRADAEWLMFPIYKFFRKTQNGWSKKSYQISGTSYAVGRGRYKIISRSFAEVKGA